MTKKQYTYKFTIRRGRGIKPWRFRILGLNGEIVSTGQGYTRSDSVIRGLRRRYGKRIKFAPDFRSGVIKPG